MNLRRIASASIDAFSIRNYFLDALMRHMNGFGQLLLIDLHRRKKLFGKHLAWMGWLSICGKANQDSYFTPLSDNRLSRLALARRQSKQNNSILLIDRILC